MLHVKRTNQNYFVYGELGRYPMYIFRYWRIISYWLKFITGKNPFISLLYHESLVNIDASTKYSWARKVRALLFESGFREAWHNQGVGDVNVFCMMFKTRLLDMYQHDWHSRLRASTRTSYIYIHIYIYLYISFIQWSNSIPSLSWSQWVINYHQHNYHQQKMAAVSSGNEQQLAISLFLCLPDSWNLYNWKMDICYDFLIRGWINRSRIFRTVGETNISHVDGNLRFHFCQVDGNFRS